MSKINPLHDKVVIELFVAGEHNVGGIVIPESAAENAAKTAKTKKGTVVAVGPGRQIGDGKFVVPTVKVGQTAVIGKFGGDEMEIDGKKFIVITDGELIATVE